MKGSKRLGNYALGVAAFSLLVGAEAWAVKGTIGTYSVNPTTTDGLAVPGFYPNAELDLVYDDNVLRQATGEQDSFSLVLVPELLLVRSAGKHLVRFGYSGEFAWHEEDSLSSEDYNDHFLAAEANLDLAPKMSLNLIGNYRKDHEPRGAPAALGVTPDYYHWDEWIASAELVYGRRIAQAQVSALLEHRRRDYSNNDDPLGAASRDHDDTELVLRLYYKVGPKTHLIVEPSFQRMKYPNSPALDNDVRRLLVGASWAFAAKTTGELKVGWTEKDYDNAAVAALANGSGIGIDGLITWRPRSYSTVKLTLQRDFDDSFAGGPTISFERTYAALDWEHKFSGRTQLEVGGNYEIDDYNAGGNDKLLGFYAGVSHEVRRNVHLGARYKYAKRDGDVLGDFDSNGFVVGVRTSFD